MASGTSTNRSNFVSILVVALLMTIASCAPTRPPVPPGVVPKPKPPTISDEQYGHTVLQGLSEKYKIDYTDSRLDGVINVVDRLTHAARANQDPWHVYLFRAPELKNAAATRGNHVFIWSGMLDSVKNDDELATILSHEIAHVLAGHTEPDPNEELKRLAIGLSSAAVGIAAAHVANSPSIAGNVGRMTSTITEEVGSGLFINPYSRERELEADQVGLFLMADAGFNPKAAIEFWRRVQNDPAFVNGVEFFSTHPPPVDRTSALQSYLPNALVRYEKALRPEVQGLAPKAPTRPKPWEDKYYRDSKTVTAKDSFNWNTESAPSTGVTKPDTFSLPANRQISNPQLRWRVSVDKAVLYAQPNPQSKALGEFRKGAIVTTLPEKDGWVEIEKPDRGFIKIADLTPY